MDTNTLYMIYGIAAVAIVVLLPIILSMRFLIIGLKAMWARFFYKDGGGLVIFVNKAGDFAKIVVADFSKPSLKIKDKVYAIHSSMIADGRFFGMRYILFNQDDVKTTPSIYYHSSDDDGNPEYWKNTNGELLLDKDNEPIPKMVKIKRGAVLDPEFMHAIIQDFAITAVIKDLFSKQNQNFWLLVGACIGSIAAAYFMYDFINNTVPVWDGLLRQAAACAVKGG